MFYLTVHRFLARVQSPTCTTYGKFLLESIMAVLTPKSGISPFANNCMPPWTLRASLKLFLPITENSTYLIKRLLTFTKRFHTPFSTCQDQVKMCLLGTAMRVVRLNEIKWNSQICWRVVRMNNKTRSGISMKLQKIFAWCLEGLSYFHLSVTKSMDSSNADTPNIGNNYL